MSVQVFSTPILFNGLTLNFVMGSAINIVCGVYCNADGQSVTRQLTVKHLAHKATTEVQLLLFGRRHDCCYATSP
jgi:hypothetical protein